MNHNLNISLDLSITSDYDESSEQHENIQTDWFLPDFNTKSKETFDIKPKYCNNKFIKSSEDPLFSPIAATSFSSDQHSWTDNDEDFDPESEFLVHNYKQIWEETQKLAVDNYVVLFSIPKFGSDGKRNNIWKRCEINFLSKNTWTSKNANFFNFDEIIEDTMFIITIPNYLKPTNFYMKDCDSKDCDFPGANLNEPYYKFGLSKVISLRDGQLIHGYANLTMGIAIYFEDSAMDGMWKNSVIYYLNPSDGKWTEKQINSYGVAYLLDCRSLTFVIKNKDSSIWLKNIHGNNFHISFPGSYSVYSNGKIVQTSTNCFSKLKKNKNKFPIKVENDIKNLISLPSNEDIFHETNYCKIKPLEMYCINTPPSESRHNLIDSFYNR